MQKITPEQDALRRVTAALSECQSAAAVADVFAENAIAAERPSRLWLYLNCTITIAHVLTAIFCSL